MTLELNEIYHKINNILPAQLTNNPWNFDENDNISQYDLESVILNYLYKIEGCYENLINKRALLFKTLDLSNNVLGENDFKKLLLKHYTFLKRPVLVYDNYLFIGNSSNVTIEMKKFLSEQ